MLIQERIPVKIALINNGYLGMVRQWQQLFYEANYQQWTFRARPDLREAGRGLRHPGLAGVPAPPTIEHRWSSAAMDFPGPCLIEFVVSRGESVSRWWCPGTSTGGGDSR